jgi:hypothetical protein
VLAFKIAGVLQDWTCTKAFLQTQETETGQEHTDETERCTIVQQSIDDNDFETYRIGEDIAVLDLRCPRNSWSSGARQFWVSKFSANKAPACDNDS